MSGFVFGNRLWSTTSAGKKYFVSRASMWALFFEKALACQFCLVGLSVWMCDGTVVSFSIDFRGSVDFALYFLMWITASLDFCMITEDCFEANMISGIEWHWTGVGLIYWLLYGFVCEMVDGILRYHLWHSIDGFWAGPGVNDIQRVETTVWDAGV